MTPLRALLGGLLLCLLAGTPGLGLETRTGGSILIGSLYAVPFLAAIGALVSTWRWPGAVGWLALIAAISAAILSALDLVGLTDPQRPPMAIAIVEVGALVVSLAIALVLRPRANVTARG